MEDNLLRSWLALSFTPKVGPVTFARLLTHFGSVENIFKSSREKLIENGCSATLADSLLNPPWSLADQELELARKNGFTILTKADPQYPSLLKNISSAPFILYARGDLSFLDQNSKSIAVVGSRQTSSYGIQNCRNFVQGLVASRITVVSGFAKGIDINAHMMAVEAGGISVAVLGSGLGKIYPSENIKYVEKFLKQGVILSEFPYLTEARPEFFPRRNRLVSGMSHGILVIECTEKSGALITANFAAEQGRDVFAIPGSIHMPLSKGPHHLISQGAKLVQSVDDILSEWQLQPAVKPARKSEVKTAESGSFKTVAPENKSLPVSWKKIYDYCQLQSRVPDELSLYTSMGSAELLGVLTQMEMEGHLKRLPGNRYCAIQ